MKAQTRGVRAAETAKQRHPAARVRTKPRSGAGNRHRADAHERKADEVAARALKGERNLSRSIAPSPAAAYRAAASVPRPLSKAIRAQMEAAFGADLSAVRIHTGAEADAATRELGARAFTTGPNIYFRRGRYRPDSGTGAELLAHELVHVLQQTGRRDASGRLRATAVEGTGEVQHKDEDIFPQAAEDYGLLGGPSDWDTIKKAYSGVTDIETHIAIINPLIPATLPMTAGQIKALAAEVRKPGFKSLPDEIKGLYIDALKLGGANETARLTLLSNRKAPTAFRSRAFYESVRAASLDWIDDVTKANAFASRYYPAKFVAAYRAFFLSPGREPVDLEPSAAKGGSFKDLIFAEIDRLKAVKGLLPNELQVTALFALDYLDETRRTHLRNLVDSERSKGRSLLVAYQRIADWFLRGSADELAPAILPECKALFAAVLPEIRQAADQAAKFWQHAIDFQTAYQTGKAFGNYTDVEVKAIAAGIKTDARLKRLPALLRNTATLIFARSKGNLLSAATFAGRVTTVRDALAREIATYEPRIEQLIAGAKLDDPEALRLGLAVALLSDVEQPLEDYDPALDLQYQKRKLADVRIGTRIRLARELLRIALLFGWTDVRDAANAVFQEGPQLAILSKWEPDLKVDFGSLSKESGGEFAGSEGTKISGALLDQYNYIQFYEQLTEQIRMLLATRGDAFLDKTPILTEAIRTAKANVKRPRRFFVRDWVFGQPALANVPGAQPAPPAKLSDILFTHPLYTELKDAEKHEDDLPIGPAEVPPNQLFVWFIPRMDEFIHEVAQLKVVRKAVDANWAKEHPNTAPPDPERDWLMWFGALDALAQALAKAIANKDEKSKQLLKDIGDAIAGTVETKFAQAQKEAFEAARDAVTHERRILVESELLPQLNRFDRYDLGQWAIPDRIFSVIRDFAVFVWPPQDQPLQVSTMVFEIADGLVRAFGNREETLGTSRIDRWDIIDIVGILAYEALRVWDAGEQQASKQVATGGASPVNPMTALSWLPQGEMAKRAEMLRKLRDDLAANALSQQKMFGIHAKKDAKTITSVYFEKYGWQLIKWNMTYTELTVGSAFILYGDQYAIIDVNESFTFHPAFGGRDTLSVHWPSSEQRPGNALLLDASDSLWKPSGTKLVTIMRTRPGRDAELIEITDKDTAKLEWLSGVISEHFAFEYMAGAGVLIEKYANLILDVLEFIPGWGQGVAAARFAATILSTLADPQFQDIIKAFKEDGFGAFSKIFDAFGKVVDMQEMVNYLIFDSDFVEKTRKKPELKGTSQRQERASTRGGPWVRIAKILKTVIEIGVHVLDRFKRLIHHIQTPVRDAQLWVLRTPIAALVLDVVERAFDYLSSLSIDDLAESAELLMEKGWKQLVQDLANKTAQEVLDRGRGMLENLKRLELPEEVIPVEWIIDFLIDLVVRALSAKYRKGVQAVRGILRTIGLWDKVLKGITDLLYEAGADPNEKIWRKEVRDKLEPWLEEVRDAFWRQLMDELKEVPFLDKLAEPKGTPVNLEFSGLGFPEAEGHGAGANPAGFVLPPGALSGGAPLGDRERRRAEAAFGHDFGHVRVHRGPEPDRITRSAEADALTTGSHIFIFSSVDPDDPGGRRVLHHELAHVAQQTGPRPLGRQHSDAPSAGRPGPGLRWDAARESAADHAAELTHGGRVAREPLAVGGRSAGIQPAFTKKFLRKFLAHLHSDADIGHAKAEFEKAKKSPATDPESVAVTAALGPALKQWLSKADTYEQPFKAVHSQLQTFAESVWPQFEKEIPLLVTLARATMAPPKSAEVEEESVAYIPPENLKVELERSLYGLTAMAFVIEVNAVKGPKTVKERHVVDKNKPIKKVSIAYVHLPLLPDNADSAKVWDLLIENTFKASADYTTATHPSFVAAARLVISRGTPSPDNYERTQFKLSKYRTQVVRNQRDRLVTYTDPVKTKDWPTSTQYTQTSTAGLPASVEDYGLRLGTYGVWGSKTVVDRDAHHPVQFLLVEYFRNVKPKQPFPLAAKQPYPGVSAPTGEVDSIHLGSQAINISGYYPNRGGSMPTLFIAKTTHLSGIHYRSEPPDDGSARRTTQGAAMNNEFRDEMGDLAPVLDSAVTLAELAKMHKEGKDVDPIDSDKKPKGVDAIVSYSRVNTAIFNAAQSSYKDMWSGMKPKLKRALEVQEVAYYNAIAKLRGLPTIDKSVMAKPFKEASDEVEKTMGGGLPGAGFGPGFSPPAI